MSKKGINIYKRKDNRYEGRYAHEKDINGKIHYKSVYGKSYNECLKKLIRAKADFIDSKKISKVTMTVDILSQKWLSGVCPKVKKSTFYTYKRILENHILPFLGKIRICDVTVERLNDVVSKKLSLGRLDGKGGLTPKTVINIICVLKAVFKYAKRTYNAENPTEFMDTPKISKSKTEVLDNEEIKKIKKYCKENDGYFSFAVELCLSLGLRIGELCALQVSDFELEKGVLTVSKTVQRIKNDKEDFKKTKVIISSPKTSSSERQIPLTEKLIKRVKAHILKYSLMSNDFLFKSRNGKRADVRTLQKNFAVMLKNCGIRHVKFHILRHTFATHWVNSNLNIKALSEILGHSNVNTTLSLYVHPSFDIKRNMMNNFYLAV